jgi:hypothetical protein
MLTGFPTPVQSGYFAPRDIEIDPGEVVVTACARNEGPRLPHFLDHYRSLGVTRFLLVDNDSRDETQAFLEKQPDVEYFWTDSSYRGSSAGRLWMQELADAYLTDRWVVTADVDELLVFPGAEALDLRDLCAYMDESNQVGLFTVMLDMYSDLPLSQTTYEPGTDFLETCHFFETDTYWLQPGANPPFLSVFGGPRDRLFRHLGEQGKRPMMKKIPLVKWESGFSYMFSTHSSRFVQLSDVTGALLHFKFFNTFRDLAVQEAARGDRRQHEHYTTYRENVEDDVCFYGKQSHQYRGPVDLVRLGVMRSSDRFARFAETQAKARGSDLDTYRLLPSPVAPEGSLTLRSIAAVWPLVNNAGIGQYFGQIDTPPSDRRLAFVKEMGRHVKVVDVKADHLLLFVEELALHRWRASRLGISVHVGRRVLCNRLVDGSDEDLTVAVDSLEPNACRLNVDIGRAALAEQGERPDVPVTVYLFDGEDDCRLAAPLDSPEAEARPGDEAIYSRSWYPDGGQVYAEHRFGGVLERLDDGVARGWVYDAERDSFDVPVCIYLNGRLARHVWPSRRRVDLDGFWRGRASSRGRGFIVDLPLGYVEQYAGHTTVEVAVAGRNMHLRRTPLLLPAGARTAVWDKDRAEWSVAAVDRRAPGN